MAVLTLIFRCNYSRLKVFTLNVNIFSCVPSGSCLTQKIVTLRFKFYKTRRNNFLRPLLIEKNANAKSRFPDGLFQATIHILKVQYIKINIDINIEINNKINIEINIELNIEINLKINKQIQQLTLLEIDDIRVPIRRMRVFWHVYTRQRPLQIRHISRWTV